MSFYSIMKGRGKGKAMPVAQELVDCPLQFADLVPVDHTQICPLYTNIVNRNEDEVGIAEEETDALQLELETLLVSVNNRMHTLDSEIDALISWQDAKSDPSGAPAKLSKSKSLPASTPKRGRPPESSKSAKKQKLEINGKGTVPTPAKMKSKTSAPAASSKQLNVSSDYEFADSPMLDRTAVVVPKNDIPNKFWSFVEPYCSDITQDDLKFLEELMQIHEGDAEYYKIPALGKHYSSKWAAEELLEEKKEGAKSLESKKQAVINGNESPLSEVNGLLSRAESADSDSSSEDSSPFGHLTQRLVSALIEENIMVPAEDTALAELAASGKEPELNGSMTRSGLVRTVGGSSSVMSVERRLRRELEEQGLLDSNNDTKQSNSDNPDDEILRELRKCQAELKAVTAHNLMQKKRFYRLAKEEMAKQELRKKMQIVDMEVMEAYRRVIVTRQKQKIPTKKERELVWKALKDREAIIKALHDK